MRTLLARGAAVAVVAATVIAARCSTTSPPIPDNLTPGTWGGEGVGVIVEATNVHVHVNCTKGDFPAPVALDEDGRFSIAGEYVLRAYPVEIGPPLPAQLAGVVRGRQLTLTVAVNDTVEKKLVVLGPVTVVLGRDPQMGPCPICDRRDGRAAMGVTAKH